MSGRSYAPVILALAVGVACVPGGDVTGERTHAPNRSLFETAPPPNPLQTTAATGAVQERPPSTPSSNDTHHLSFRGATATVFLDCQSFWIDVTPDDLPYHLVLTFVDSRTEQRYRFIAGPFTDRVDDRFGSTAFDLVEVVVKIPRSESVAVERPDRC